MVPGPVEDQFWEVAIVILVYTSQIIIRTVYYIQVMYQVIIPVSLYPSKPGSLGSPIVDRFFILSCTTVENV